MPRDETKRVQPNTLEADETSFTALQAITTYNPNNTTYSTAALTAAHTALNAAQQAEIQAEAAYKSARDNAVAKEWAFHDLVLGMKDQVIAQYGRSSNEAQAVGLKKKSEYRRRRGTPPTT